jgi:hypothetical protein
MTRRSADGGLGLERNDLVRPGTIRLGVRV